MANMDISMLTGAARTGAGAVQAYVSRTYQLVAGETAADAVDARRVLQSLMDDVDVAKVSLTAHQNLALEEFVRHGEASAIEFLEHVQNRRAVLQGYLADRLTSESANVAEISRQLREARAFKIAAEGAGPLLDAAFYLHHVAEGETDKAVLDAIGFAVGVLAGAVVVATGGSALVAAGVALGIGGGTQFVGARFDDTIEAFTNTLISHTTTAFEAINVPVMDYFLEAANWQPRRDPLVLDLDGDGVETVSAAARGGVLFDTDGDGIRTATGWVGPDDGLLALDRDGNGTIDHGGELFGDRVETTAGEFAADGFEALATLDQNADGRIDAADADFEQLRVWTDVNQDGISQAAELRSLDELGIASLSTSGVASQSNLGHGNSSIAEGTYERTDGTQGKTFSLLFSENTFNAAFSEDLPVTPEAAVLPNFPGSGQVRELRQAASISFELERTLDAYAKAPTRDTQLALLDELLLQWADTSAMPTMEQRALSAGYQIEYRFESPTAAQTDNSTGSAAVEGEGGGQSAVNLPAESGPEQRNWMQRIGVLERFTGIEFISFERSLELAAPESAASSPAGGTNLIGVIPVVVSEQQVESLSKAYEALRQSVYYGLVMDTRLSPFAELVSVQLEHTGELVLDYSLVESAFREHVSATPQQGLIDLHEFAMLIDDWHASDLVAELVHQHASKFRDFGAWPHDGVVFHAAGSELGATGNELASLVTGDSSDNLLKGGKANDTLLGGDGDDRLIGGAGSDVLHGGPGDDIVGDLSERGDYTLQDGIKVGNHYAGGLGNDLLYGTNFDDTYRYSKGDGMDELRDPGGNNTLQLGEGITPDAVWAERVDNQHLKLYFGDSADHVLVADWYAGKGIDNVEFANGTVWDREQLLSLDPGRLSGTASADRLVGKSMSEHISGLDGDDSINGGGGDDLLQGGGGDDVLAGGYGADRLQGGPGADLLIGGPGSDIFEGGAGDDVLGSVYERGWGAMVDGRRIGNSYRGGIGNDHSIGTNRDDTYYFARGDGEDSIREMSGSQDELVFEGDISAEQLWFSRSGSDLLVSVLDSTDRVSIENWFWGRGRTVERFRVESGEVLEHTQLSQLINAMAAFDPPSGAAATVSPEQREAVAPVIAAVWQTSV